jgi:hypothetical protein
VDGDALLRLWRPFAALRSPREIALAFAPWLAEQRFDVAGFDFCFALPASQAARLGLPGGPEAAQAGASTGVSGRRVRSDGDSRSGPSQIGALLAARFGDDALAFRAAAGPEQRRATDVLRRAPFAATNLRMFRQTFWGLRALAGVREPIAPWSDGPRCLFEVLPRRRVTALCGACSYKDRSARAGRERLVAALGLRVSPADGAAMVDDAEGDAIDAVLAALEARDARTRGETAPAEAVRSGEGWIYSGDDALPAAKGGG